jgi:hypothetical protein
LKTVFFNYASREIGVNETNNKLIFKVFQLRISEISELQGMGQSYIQSQLEEVCHPFELQHKYQRNLPHGF